MSRRSAAAFQHVLREEHYAIRAKRNAAGRLD